MKEDCLNSID